MNTDDATDLAELRVSQFLDPAGQLSFHVCNEVNLFYFLVEILINFDILSHTVKCA